MPKSKEEIKALIEALQEGGFEPRSYSGRGMYGKCCVSVYDVSAWDVARELFGESHDFVIPEPLQDAMGLGNVLYWPSYEWPEEEKK